MNPRLFFLLSGLLIVGAGCYESPVSLDKYERSIPATPSETGLTPPPSAPPEAAVVASTTVSAPPVSLPTSTPPIVTTPEKLAFPGILPTHETTNVLVHLATTKGDIVFEILPKEGPKAASNFVYLVQHKFYDGLTFHRVVPGFVIQGGDPLGTGTGGPGYNFEDDAVHLPYNAGIVAMANAGPNTNGSQFFIMLENNPLPPSYSIFGRVIKGMDVVKKIGMGDVMTKVTLEKKK